MSENARVEEIVRNAVDQALERQLASLRDTVVQEVLRDIRPALAAKGGKAPSGSATLQKAVLAIQSGATQKEILRALLDSTVLYSERAALFVIKNGAATGWQGISFSHNDAIKDFSLDVSSGLAARVMQSRTAESGNAAEVDQHFMSKFSAPADGNAIVLPLLLKGQNFSVGLCRRRHRRNPRRGRARRFSSRHQCLARSYLTAQAGPKRGKRRA